MKDLISIRAARRAAVLVAAAACLLVGPVASASAAPSPWWQVVTGSHPTNLWEADDNLQEIETEIGEYAGLPGAASRVDVGGEGIGCLATANFVGESLCGFYGFPVSETAAQLEAALETAYGPEIEVTGGPVGGEPFVVRVFNESVPPISLFQDEAFPVGTFDAKVLNPGGSGRLVITLTNVGDAPLDATSTPLTIVDELPEGVEAVGYEAVGGVQGSAGPVDCVLEAADLVSCSFEDVLTSYEAIEIEVIANLTGEPPAEGAPGQITVSGGNGPSDGAVQEINVSPEETPFGIEHFSTRIEEEGGAPAVRAGAHPFQLTTSIQFNSGFFEAAASRGDSSVEQPAQPRNLRFPLPAGFVGNVTTVPTCSLAQFYAEHPIVQTANQCPDASAVGAVSFTVVLKNSLGFLHPAVPVFNLPPAEGEPARLGFRFAGVATIVDLEVDPDNSYRIIASVDDETQVPKVLAATLSIWGTPGDPRHDPARGWGCVYQLDKSAPCQRPANLGEDAFLRLPVSWCDPVGLRS